MLIFTKLFGVTFCHLNGIHQNITGKKNCYKYTRQCPISIPITVTPKSMSLTEQQCQIYKSQMLTDLSIIWENVMYAKTEQECNMKYWLSAASRGLPLNSYVVLIGRKLSDANSCSYSINVI